jgi:glycosyltransferase involved in cell wall biosynthesis
MLRIREQEVASRAAAKSLDGLRVLHVGKFYPPHPGGMETHLQSLCGELKRVLDVEVVVANSGRKTAREVVGGIEVTRLGTSFNVAAAPVCPRLTRTIRHSKADLVHLHWPHPTAVLAYLASGRRGPLVLTYHSDIVRQKIMGRAFWPALRRVLSQADAVIATSPGYLNSSPVLQKFREHCRVIPLGIPLERFDEPDTAEVARIRQSYGQRIVLGVGRLVYYKGFEYLIRAMRDVSGQLIIVGSGPLRGELESEARRCGVGGRVHILSGVRDVAPYYHAADVFALPSVARSEAFGIVQLEAMACGLPVVNTLLDSGVNFVSQAGRTGLTVPPADAAALGLAINALLGDPELRAEYGRAGRLRVEREFSHGVMADRTLRLYEEVMSAKF